MTVTARITLELNTTLDIYLPDDAPAERGVVEASAGETPLSLIERLGIPRHDVHLVFLNGALLPEGRWGQALLNDGDVLSLWPLLAGG